MEKLYSVLFCISVVILQYETGHALRFNFLYNDDDERSILSSDDLSAISNTATAWHDAFGTVIRANAACSDFLVDACGENSVCSPDGVMVFACNCMEGNFEERFSVSSYSCDDVDECVNATDLCASDADCDNIPGSFNCICHEGFAGDGLLSGFGCTDVDECMNATDVCTGGSSCNNTIGSFFCTCPEGYEGDGLFYGSGCTDADECVDETDTCVSEAECKNTNGSFFCICHEGYVGNGLMDGSGCADIDECVVAAEVCSSDASCGNTPGSFECICHDGYDGDGLVNGTGCTALPTTEPTTVSTETVETTTTTVETTTTPPTTPSVVRESRRHYLLWLQRNGSSMRSLDIKMYKKLSPYPIEYLDGRRHFADPCL